MELNRKTKFVKHCINWVASHRADGGGEHGVWGEARQEGHRDPALEPRSEHDSPSGSTLMLTRAFNSFACSSTQANSPVKLLARIARSEKCAKVEPKWNDWQAPMQTCGLGLSTQRQWWSGPYPATGDGISRCEAVKVVKSGRKAVKFPTHIDTSPNISPKFPPVNRFQPKYIGYFSLKIRLKSVHSQNHRKST